MNHIAAARNSSRKHQSSTSDNCSVPEEVEVEHLKVDILQVSHESSHDQDKLSTDNDVFEVIPEPELSRLKIQPNISRSSSDVSRATSKLSQKTRFTAEPLARITTLEDIEAFVDEDLSQAAILDSLEKKWVDLTNNFSSVMQHLEQCGREVSEASLSCLISLNDEVKVTCDNLGEETRCLYLLMNKCDELNTKLSVVELFREEIKTLRKSVETLENLYKSCSNIQ